jgi:hypothetical protein
MKKINAMGSMVLAVCLGLGCSGSALKSHHSGGTSGGGQGGSAGGAASGSVGTSGGAGPGSISIATSGGTPAATSSGGLAGTTAGAPMDASVVLDAAPDACRTVASCDLLPSCPTGQTLLSQPCACPICVAVDAGQPDTGLCPPTCPVVKCAYGSVRDPVCGCSICIEPDAGVGKDATPIEDASPDACLALPCANPLCPAGTRTVTHPCACPTCEPVDAGVDAEKMACVGLDECACLRTKGCVAVAESCYCPYPQCDPSGACFCGGGKYLSCAPEQLEECTAAKDRVAKLCPNLSGPSFDGLCKGTDNACVTKCLKEVNACSDISCSMCEACDCASDAFMRCRSTCKQ